jgi:hypothetical protein
MASLTNDHDQNYELFLEQAVDTGVVWGLTVDQGSNGEEDIQFAICNSADVEGIDVMPFWSSESFAKSAGRDEWSSYQALPIDLDDFIDNWLPGLQKDGFLVGVNWTEQLEGNEEQPLDLSLDLLETD